MYGAQLAAALGLPYAFASHFAPDLLEPALTHYRAHFQPSTHLDKPHVMLGVSVFAADSDAKGRRLFTSQQQAFINLRSGRPGQLPPPVDDIAPFITDPRIGPMLDNALSCAFAGNVATVKQGLDAFIARHAPDEIMVTSNIYDHAARLKSYELLAAIDAGA